VSRGADFPSYGWGLPLTQEQWDEEAVAKASEERAKAAAKAGGVPNVYAMCCVRSFMQSRAAGIRCGLTPQAAHARALAITVQDEDGHIESEDLTAWVRSWDAYVATYDTAGD